jgi:MauM/NapG family ferredoxin protein
MRRLSIIRRLSQFLFFGFFIYILWSTTYPLKGFIRADAFFKADPLIMLFNSLSARTLIPGIGLSILMVLATIVFGRFFCGWICPLGASIDLIGSLRKNKRSLAEVKNIKISGLKYIVLSAIAVSSLFGIQIAWLFDPMVIMGRFVSINLIPTLTLAINNIFIALLKSSSIDNPVYDLYRTLKESILGIRTSYFSNASVVLLLFFIIVSSSLMLPRLWCRAICPLGAIYSIASRFSILRRITERCSFCGRCKELCRMGAIKEDSSCRMGECILCMDCLYDCPQQKTRFSFFRTNKREDSGQGGINRKEFLLLIVSSVFLAGFKGFKSPKKTSLIRPPGASNEERFLNLCVRCGNCMRVCPTNVLQPAFFESGLSGIWTPHLVNDIGYCEYNCNLCGEVCPTGAIPKLPVDEKKKARLGTAVIDKERCFAWNDNQLCLVCEEHCPLPEKAIKVEDYKVSGRIVGKPVIREDLCIGCGICQNKCPARPVRAITIIRN